MTRDPRSALKSSLIGLLVAGSAGRTGERRDEVFAGDIFPAHRIPFRVESRFDEYAFNNKKSMITRLINTTKRVLGQSTQGRYFEVFDDDTFIVSFPKSGNTWTRFLIANLLHPEEPANFDNIDQLIPESEGI